MSDTRSPLPPPARGAPGSEPSLDPELGSVGETELSQAAALAAALERGTRPVGVEVPETELATAAFLRHQRAPDLPADAKERVLADLLVHLQKAEAPRRASRFGLGWLWWLGPALAAGGVWLLVQRSDPDVSLESASKANLTAPAGPKAQQQALLQAQAELIHAGTMTTSPRFTAALELARSGWLADSGLQPELRQALWAHHRSLDSARTDSARQIAKNGLLGSLAQLDQRRGRSPVIDRLLEDGYFRLAQQEQVDGHFQAAQRFADRGLAVSEQPGVMRANLWLAKACAQRSLGDPQAAANSLLRALELNESLLKETLK